MGTQVDTDKFKAAWVKFRDAFESDFSYVVKTFGPGFLQIAATVLPALAGTAAGGLATGLTLAKIGSEVGAQIVQAAKTQALPLAGQDLVALGNEAAAHILSHPSTTGSDTAQQTVTAAGGADAAHVALAQAVTAGAVAAQAANASGS